MTESRASIDKSRSTPFQLGEWRVEPAAARLIDSDREVRLEPRVMDLLVCLASRPGEVLTRQELESQVWANMVVGYDSLTSTIIKLRKALGDDSKNPSYIETIPKRGYRLIAPVTEAPTAQPVARKENTEQPTTVPAEHPGLSRRKPRYLYIALAGLAIITVAVYLATISVDFDTGDRRSITADKPAIAVLPFTNLSDDPEQEYFSDGITDDLITDLSRYSGLLVISRRSAFIYKTRTVDLQSLAKELGVRYVVEGSVRLHPKANKLRVNVQLVDAVSGINIWAQRFDRDAKDIFQVQDDIREKIIDTLSVKITEEEQQRNQRRYTNSFEAYDYFLRAQHSLIRRSSAKDYQKTRDLLQKAITIDPEFTRAYGALALAHADAYRFEWTNNAEQTANLAVQTGKHAVELDPDLPQTHWIMGYIYLFVQGDHEHAIDMGKRTVELDPNSADGYTLLGVTYVHAGQPERALHFIEQAKRLNPHYPSQVPSVIGLSNLLLENYEQSLTAYDESLLINATRIQSLVYKVVVLVRMGRLDDAQWAMQQLYSYHPQFNIDNWIARQPHKDKAFKENLVRDFLRAKG